MGRSVEEYKRLLQSLLPRGRIWPRNDDSTMAEVLAGIATELSRVEGRQDDLIVEAHVTTTTELVTDHEEDFGLPEVGEELDTTIAGRREDLHSKLVAVGQQDKGYFIAIAAALGFTVDITEHRPAWSGIAAAGDPCGDQENIFYWTAVISIPLGVIPIIDALKYQFEKLKPAHTLVLFDYDGPAFARAFDWAFDSIPWYDGSFWPGEFGAEYDSSFATAYAYDGKFLKGGFDHAFGLGFKGHWGGDFEFNAFDTGFWKPA